MESEWQTIKRELISSFLKSRFIMVDFHLKILKKWEEKKKCLMRYFRSWTRCLQPGHSKLTHITVTYWLLIYLLFRFVMMIKINICMILIMAHAAFSGLHFADEETESQ